MNLKTTYDRNLYLYNKKALDLRVNDYIEQYPKLSAKLIEEFNLYLVDDVFMHSISDASYNGIKKQKLKNQKIKFIEISLVFSQLLDGYEGIINFTDLNNPELIAIMDIFMEYITHLS